VKAEITGKCLRSTSTTMTEMFAGPPDFRDLDMIAEIAGQQRGRQPGRFGLRYRPPQPVSRHRAASPGTLGSD
jgi:hypothetical protein